MRTPVLAAAVAASAVSLAVAQCPDYSGGVASAAIGKFNGGHEARLVYVDCLQSIAFIEAKFGRPGGSTPLDGLPLTLAIYDDPNDDLDPSDAVLVSQISVPGGVTGGNTGNWQSYDVEALSGGVVPATGGMWVAVAVSYGAGAQPASIEFNNNAFPGTQWLASDVAGGVLDFATMSNNLLLNVSTGPGFPPGTWIVRVEEDATYREFGSGCAGSNGTPELSGLPGSPPILGASAILTAQNLPVPGTPTLLMLGLDRLRTPLDLGPVGMPGCTLDIDLLALVPVTSSGGMAAWAAPIPNAPTLVGRALATQLVTLDTPANALGITTSNGVEIVIGQ